MLACIRIDISAQIFLFCIYIQGGRGEFTSLLALRHLPGRLEPPAASPRRLQVVQRELHVCKMCVEYDTSYAKHCKEPTAEEVRKKDEANFCDHFKPKAGAYVAKDTAAIERAKSALDDLFRK